MDDGVKSIVDWLKDRFSSATVMVDEDGDVVVYPELEDGVMPEDDRDEIVGVCEDNGLVYKEGKSDESSYLVFRVF